MGYVCRNPSLANTCQRADKRNSGLWVHSSWLISQVWFPALKTQILLVFKLLLRPEQTQWEPELNLKASYLKHPEVLTNISLNFLMLHKLIFTIDKYVISRTKAVFWSRNGKCTQCTICGIILSLYLYIWVLFLQNLLQKFECTGKRFSFATMILDPQHLTP